jgi:PAS domain S-box-containing protein
MIIFSTVIKIAALISYIVLSLLTLKSNAPANVRRSFFIYIFGMIQWQFGSLMVNFSKNPQTALFWYSFLLSGSGLHTILFFPFTRAFLGIKGQKKITYFAYIASIFFGALGLSGLGIKGVHMGQGGIYIPELRNIVPLLGLVMYFFFGYGVFNLIRGLIREKSPFQRNRIKYPLVGAIIVILGAASNFTPLQDFPVDISCNLINAVLIGYAVIRYRLLDIRIILTRGLSYSLLTGSVVGIYIVSILVSERVLKSYFGYTSSLSGIVAILILAFVFLPLRNGIQKGVDRMFFREKQDYQRILESFSRAVTSVLDLEELLNLILTTVTKTIKVNKAFIALFNEERGEYIAERFYIEQDAIPRVTFKRDSLLARWLEREGLPLLGEEMKMDPKFETLLEESREIFEKMGVSLVVPILLKGRLTGTINLGEKLSSEIYNYEDMRFLTTIANQTATAIDNASAYKEIERRLSEQTLLFILGETFRKPIGFDKIMYSVVEVLMNFLNIDYCLIIYFEEDSFKTYSHGLSEILIEKIKTKCANMANDPAARIYRDESFLFLDIGSRFKGESGLSDKEREVLESSVYLLFKQSDEILGVLVTPKRGAVDQKETDLFRSIRAIVSPGIMLHRTIVNLVEMKSYNESILNSMNSGVVVIDTDKRITTINREAERMTGLRSEDVVGRHIYEAEVLHQLSPVVSETMSTEEPIVNREVSIRLVDGRKIPLGVSTSILIDAENRTKGVVSIFMDLSQIKQLESQLIRSEKLASVGQLAAGVSHELRNPLGSIFGYAELLNERISSDDEVVKRGLRTILAESERSQHIIESLLDYARMREPSLVTTDLNKVVENTLPLIKHQLSQENVALEVFLEENLPPVQVDEEQMKQVFINLILNAQQAMAGGGRLTISTHQEDGWVKVSFQDAGCGIPEENMGKLFDPFFTTKEYGTGLGLPTVHRIVESHDGLIEVESKVGAGSKFTVSLMASPEDVRSTAESPRGSALQM